MLLFIAEHARALEDWQRDVMHIVRAEQLYFRPQMQTKIMNEGWAAYWHARIMRELELSPRTSTSSFRGCIRGVLSPSRRQINPYYVGMKMFEDIERRFGMLRASIEVRELDNDVSFLRNYLTQRAGRGARPVPVPREGDKWVSSRRTGRKFATRSCAA